MLSGALTLTRTPSLSIVSHVDSLRMNSFFLSLRWLLLSLFLLFFSAPDPSLLILLSHHAHGVAYSPLSCCLLQGLTRKEERWWEPCSKCAEAKYKMVRGFAPCRGTPRNVDAWDRKREKKRKQQKKKDTHPESSENKKHAYTYLCLATITVSGFEMTQ